MNHYPPLLLKYLRIYQENPKSKIFAPLAEAYRKLNLLDEAIEICREGLTFNPNFDGGKVALARVYADKKDWAQVREVLAPVIERSPENLAARKLLAEAAASLGRLREALEHYKFYLYLCPQDESIASLLQELEESQMRQAHSQIQNFTLHENPDQMRKVMKLKNVLKKVETYRQKIA